MRSYGWERTQALEYQVGTPGCLSLALPRSSLTMDLLPGAGTAGGFDTVQAGALGKEGEEAARQRLRLFSQPSFFF